MSAIAPDLVPSATPVAAGHFSNDLLRALEQVLAQEGAVIAREAHRLLGFGSRIHTGRALNELVRIGRVRRSELQLHGNVVAHVFWLADSQTATCAALAHPQR